MSVSPQSLPVGSDQLPATNMPESENNKLTDRQTSRCKICRQRKRGAATLADAPQGCFQEKTVAPPCTRHARFECKIFRQKGAPPSLDDALVAYCLFRRKRLIRKRL